MGNTRKEIAFVTLVGAAVLLAGCRFVLPEVAKQSGIVSSGAQSRAISDAVHGAGNPHFFFLPPIVPKSTPTGVFQPSLLPVVEICELAVDNDGDGVADAYATDAGGNAIPIAPPFTTTSGPGSETIRVESGYYIVNWHTDAFDLHTRARYRIRVRVGSLVLGHADVIVGASNAELKNVDTNEFIPLKDGRTLPIKFRIEEGALSFVGPDGGALSFAGGNVTIDVPAGALPGFVQMSAEPKTGVEGSAAAGLLLGGLYDFGPPGAFLRPVRVTMSYADDLLPCDETELTLVTKGVDGWVELASRVDTQAKTVSGFVEHFTPVGKAPKVDSIIVSPLSASIQVGGAPVRLTASTFDANGTELFGYSVNWLDSPKHVVTLTDPVEGPFDGIGRPIQDAGADPSVTTTTTAEVQAKIGNAFGVCSVLVMATAAGGIITTMAGNGAHGYAGDGGPAALAQFNNPSGMTIDAAGNIYVADAGNCAIRKLSTDGTISTVAGNGTLGYSGDGGPATAARLSGPNCIAVDAGGNLYIADTSNNRIRKVDADGTITTIAGKGGEGYSGDEGPATLATLAYPAGVVVDSAGNLYIADYFNYRVRKVSPNGIITTVAGNGTPGDSGDGGPAISAGLNYPTCVALDVAGNLYIADNYDSIRKVDGDGMITTIAGNGTGGYSGDGGPATSAQLYEPVGITFDTAGNLYIADLGNSRIRKVSTSGTITTVAGTGTPGYSGDGGPAAMAELWGPSGVAVDRAGNLYFVDAGNQRIRKVSAP